MQMKPGKVKNYAFRGKGFEKKRLPFFQMKMPIIAGVVIAGVVVVLVVIFLFRENQTVYMQTEPIIENNFRTEDQEGNTMPAKTSESMAPAVQEKFVSLLKKNADTIGWINVPGTRIDYPVVQSSDDSFYMENDFNKNKAAQGSIFMDINCDISEMKGNYVLFGHNMRDGSMFADLLKYKENDFFTDNPVITFNTIYGDYQWQIFSVYVAPVSFNYIDTTFLSQESWEKFIQTCKDKSIFENEVIPKANDIVLTLSTCAYDFDNARFVVQAIMIKN